MGCNPSFGHHRCYNCRAIACGVVLFPCNLDSSLECLLQKRKPTPLSRSTLCSSFSNAITWSWDGFECFLKDGIWKVLFQIFQIPNITDRKKIGFSSLDRQNLSRNRTRAYKTSHSTETEPIGRWIILAEPTSKPAWARCTCKSRVERRSREAP